MSRGVPRITYVNTHTGPLMKRLLDTRATARGTASTPPTTSEAASSSRELSKPSQYSFRLSGWKMMLKSIQMSPRRTPMEYFFSSMRSNTIDTLVNNR